MQLASLVVNEQASGKTAGQIPKQHRDWGSRMRSGKSGRVGSNGVPRKEKDCLTADNPYNKISDAAQAARQRRKGEKRSQGKTGAELIRETGQWQKRNSTTNLS